MANDKWILIDLSFLAHRARYVVKDMSKEDVGIGIIYMFFEQLYTICRHPAINSNKVIVFTDSKRSWRMKQFPDYKKSRRQENRTQEEWDQIMAMHKQTKILKNKILPSIGISVHKQVGLESDDLMAWVAKKLTDRKEEAVMITSDGDLYQCITDYVKWYDPSKNLMMGKHDFRIKKGLEPEQWATVKSICGCSTDGVPGLKGIGEIGAIKWIKGQIPEHHKQYRTIYGRGDEIKEWAKLVVLPHEKTKPITISEPKYNPKAFFRYCKKYEILSYLTEPRKSQWKKFFKGIISGGLKKRKTKRKGRTLV